MLPGLSLLAGMVGALALATEPAALLAGGPIALMAGSVWAANRVRFAVVPWLVDRFAGHPIRTLTVGQQGRLEPALPSLQSFVRRPPDRVRWAPVLQGTHDGWGVTVGTGWVAVDLGLAVPRVPVPLDRGRFWRDVLATDTTARSPSHLDGDATILHHFGDDAGGPLVSEPLFGWRQLEQALHSDPALGRATVLDGHLVLPTLQAGVQGVQTEPLLAHAVAAADRLMETLNHGWTRMCSTHGLFSAGRIDAGTRHAAGHIAGVSVSVTDHATDARPHLRINGPELSAFSTSLARANRRRGGLGGSLRAAFRWTPLLAWDDRCVRIDAHLASALLPPGARLERVQAPMRGVGHPVLDRLGQFTGPEALAPTLRDATLAEPLVELLAMSPTTRVEGGDRTRVCLDLPLLSPGDVDAALDVLAKLSGALRARPHSLGRADS